MAKGPPPATPKTKRPATKYTVIRDTREHEGHGWHFDESPSCDGTSIEKLNTGDYAVKGLEHIMTIDRKGSCNEFVSNLYQDRFLKELGRMREIPHPYVVLEFDFEEIAEWHLHYPRIRGRVPRHWKTPGAVLARFHEIQIKCPWVQFVFAGFYGREFASSLFKRIARQYGRTAAAGEA